MLNLINQIGVAFVVPTIFLSIVVLRHWGPRAWSILFRENGPNTGESWLIVGVTVSFVGVLTNTLFWGAHFLIVALGMDALAVKTYSLGQLFNVFTRHIPFTAAAFSHLMAHWDYAKEGRWHPKWQLLAAAVCGLLAFIGLDVVSPR